MIENYFYLVKQLEVDGNHVKLAIWVNPALLIKLLDLFYFIGYSRTRTISYINTWLYVFIILII
jgi:hypothetical protein